jgi:hypothetical protein
MSVMDAILTIGMMHTSAQLPPNVRKNGFASDPLGGESRA